MNRPVSPPPSAHATGATLVALIAHGFAGRAEALAAVTSVIPASTPAQLNRNTARPIAAMPDTRLANERSKAALAIRRVVDTLAREACSRTQFRQAALQASGARLTAAERERVLADAIGERLRRTRLSRATTHQ